jgi:hypothetical protein
MIIQNRTVVDLFLVRTCIQRGYNKKPQRKKKKMAATAAAVILIAALAGILLPKYMLRLPNITRWQPEIGTAAVTPPKVYHKIEPTAASQPDSGAKLQSIEAAAKPETSATPAATDARTEKPPVQSATPPRFTRYDETLGRLTVQRNETFSGLIEQVYGVFDSRYLDLLVLANPQIENPDRIAVGQTLVLPAIPARQQPTDREAWWIVLSEKTSLEEAFAVLRNFPHNGPNIRLVPYWNPEQGPRFALVLERYFAGETSASAYLQTLPYWLASGSRVQRLPNEKTVYFADPFFGGKRG